MPEINQPVVEIFGNPPDQGQITSAIPTIAASESDYNNFINRTYRINILLVINGQRNFYWVQMKQPLKEDLLLRIRFLRVSYQWMVCFL